MKIFAFAGSTSTSSINKALVDFTLQYFNGATINCIDLNDFASPLFSVDLEKSEGHPQAAKDFLKCIEDCDAIVCSLAEHNRSYAAAFKNLFDWASRVNVKVFQDKPMLLMSTSPGAYGGGNVMKEASTFFPQFGALIKQTFSLPKFSENFERAHGIINEELLQKHLDVVNLFKKDIAQ